MVKGLPLIDHPEQPCEGCFVEKLYQATFFKEVSFHAIKPLQLVPTDVCGLITPTSLPESNYFLIFIDGFSCKTWVYFLMIKYEVFAKFTKFNDSVEKKVVIILKLSGRSRWRVHLEGTQCLLRRALQSMFSYSLLFTTIK